MTSAQAPSKDKFLSRVRSFMSSKADPPPPYSAAPFPDTEPSQDDAVHTPKQQKPPKRQKLPKPLTKKEIAIRNCQLAIEALNAEPCTHPTFLLEWAIQNPLDNTTRFRHFLHFYLSREYRVEPLPVLNEEDREYFRRLGAFLEVYDQSFHWLDHRGKTGAVDCRAHLLEKPLAALNFYNYAGGPSYGDYHTMMLYWEKLQKYIVGLIVAFAGSSGGPEQENEDNGFPLLDRAIQKGNYEFVIERLHTDMALLEKVFPYGEARAKGQAVEGIEGARALYFEAVDEEIVRREMDGRLVRVGFKGWKLTGYSKGLVERGGKGWP